MLSPTRAFLAGVVWLPLFGCSPDGSVSGPKDLPTAQVFRTPAGVANKPLVARHSGVAIADELVVRLRPGADADLIALDAGGEVVWRGRSTGALVFRFDDGVAAAAAYPLLSRHADVRDVEFNRVMAGGSGGSGVGTSPGLLDVQWNLWGLGLGGLDDWGSGEGVVVAVLDSGVAYENYADDLGVYAVAPDLSEVEFLQGYDFINDDDHANDDHGHGTHVTGVIAASAGIAPIAPGTDILPVKVLDADNLGTELALAEGIHFAVDNGADVINMSLSFPPTYFPSRLLQSSIDYASRNGVVLVAAVGNHDEDIVTYPAAFRDVIAVGASSLRKSTPVFGEDADRWTWAFWFLQRAPYSNRGYLVDFVAPAGRIDRDLDGDGNPEAIVAQSFANGDPTDFSYVFYAGTSQAAAQVSGLAALMLAENPDLSAVDLRSTIAETSIPTKFKLLSKDTGRGRVLATAAIEAADELWATRDREHFHATVFLTMHRSGKHKRRARAEVEVLDANGVPVPDVAVYGTFTGAAFRSKRRWTNEDGVAVFKSDKFGQDGKVVAFQVDAVAYLDGLQPVVDRPTGFVRIDSVSLELLADFASDLTTVPSLPGGGSAAAQASGAGGESGGTGVGTSPGITFPSDAEILPITIRIEVPDKLSKKLVPTLLLPNMSWGLATVPMAVIVEQEWFLSEFPEAVGRIIDSFGTGVGTSPFRFSRTLSFPTALPLDYDSDPERVNLVLLTFSGSGVGTSPGLFAESFYSLGVDASAALIDEALDLQWNYWWGELTGGGAGTPPGGGAGTPPGGVVGLGPLLFTQLRNTVSGYISFGAGDLSSPVGAYGAVLEAAGLDLAPVDPSADGTGIGTSPFTGSP